MQHEVLKLRTNSTIMDNKKKVVSGQNISCYTGTQVQSSWEALIGPSHCRLYRFSNQAHFRFLSSHTVFVRHNLRTKKRSNMHRKQVAGSAGLQEQNDVALLF
ncbi:hypothetical protein ATANTOWER_014081 [Ataeniobius toweri]|uniref:Uncharacterized protein n=1 Tax=Ataeniobius toweri TaxID=208326 RepID=A0ABU7BYI8_9TELE|nr:hypothetical protein [Ataeniobius toweri]